MHTPRFAVTLALTCLLSTSVRAQTGSLRVTVPSPTAASLGKFGDVPVNLYSGVPDISVPLFTVKGKTLELPITLRYHASGIRVEEIGGWAGLGWTLEAGGAITRTVRGVPDEKSNGYYNTGSAFYASGNWPNPSTSFLDNVRNEVIDGEPDRFFFSFAGRSGQFVVGPADATGTVEYRTIPHQKLKIEAAAGFSSWVITTEDGTRFTFAAPETTTDYTTPAGAKYGETHTSTWHLTKIRSVGGDSITLHYKLVKAAGVFHQMGSYREEFTEVWGQTCVPGSYSFTSRYGIDMLQLDSIASATHAVKFITAFRDDALSYVDNSQQEPRLDRITVLSPAGKVVRNFQFEHDYFSGVSRLRLKSVSERDSSGVSLPPYSFTYDEQPLPNRTSYALDHWGYYNGKTLNNTPIPTVIRNGLVLPGADRAPDPTFMKMASLTRITYPTGGYSEFVYESNDYGAIGVAGTAPTDNGPQQSSQINVAPYEGWKSTTFSVQGTQPTIAKVTVTMWPPADLWPDYGILCSPAATPCPYAEIVGHGKWSVDTVAYRALPPGGYTLQASDEGHGVSVSVTVEWQDRGITVKKKMAGGLRVAEDRTADGMGNIITRKYRYTLQSDNLKSSGVISEEPGYTHEYSSNVCHYFSRASMSKIPLGSGPPVGYREVTVWHGANGEYGKTRHTFRSVLDRADDLSIFASWPFSQRTSYEWMRGQQLETAEYNASGQVQQRARSTHQFREDPVVEPIAARRFRGMSIHYFSGGAFGDFAQIEDYKYGPFEVISGWAYQDSLITVTYDESGASSFSTTKTFTYGNTNHVQLTQLTETNSDGTQRITRMKYAADYASGSGNAEAIAITAMKDAAHMHSPVIERWVSDKVGGTARVVQAELTSFKTYASGQYLPYQRFVFDSPTPVTNFMPSAVSGSFTKDSRYLRVETANSYDLAGRIVQLADGRGNLTNYAYGGNANNAFLVATRRVNGTGGLIQRIGYDNLGNLTSIRDSLTYRLFTYDSFGRLRQIKNHAGTVVQAFGYIYSRTAPNWTFDPANPNAVVDTTYLRYSPSVWQVVRDTYHDGLGRPVQTVEHGASDYIVTVLQYDAMGREWRKWKPYRRIAGGYDANFVVNGIGWHNADNGGVSTTPYTETRYTADALSRVTQVVPEFLGTTPTISVQYAYGVDAGAQQSFTEVTDEVGMKTRRYRDVFGNEVKTVLGYGGAQASTTLLAYNVLGQRIQAIDPRGLSTTYTLDTRGHQTGRSNPDAGTTSWKYDAANNLRYSQDANQAAAGQVYFTTYDFADRPLVSGQGAATFSSLDPDATSPPALETNTAHWLTVRGYDAKPSATTFPWNRFSAQIASLTLANAYGRLAAVANRSNGAWQAEFFSYDSEGRIATRYTFTEANGGGPVLTALNTTVVNTYHLHDSLTRRDLTIGANSFYHWYDYNHRGWVWRAFASTSTPKPATPDVIYSYRPNGKLQTRQFQGGSLVPLRYTMRDQLESIGTETGGPEPFAARYAYNADGTVAQASFRSDGAPTTQKRYLYDLLYDARKRLAHAQFYNFTGSGWSSTNAYTLAGMQYDLAGNLGFLARYRSTASLVDYLTYTTAPNSNRLNSLAEQIGVSPETWDAEAGMFTYDANGNMITAPEPYAISSATYDHTNLPTSLTRNSVTTTYRYNADGQRIAKQVGAGNTEFYILDGRTTLAVFAVDGAGSVASSHFNIVALNKVVGREASAVKHYYHTDLLGSTRAVVQANGAIVESYDYDPWGVLLEGRILAGPTKEGFTGKERDPETGLDYFGLRYYMPAVGRWTTVDPLADSFPSWSPYNYVYNNPVAYTDLFGLEPCDPPDAPKCKASQPPPEPDSPKPAPAAPPPSPDSPKPALAAAAIVGAVFEPTPAGELFLLAAAFAALNDAVTRSTPRIRARPRNNTAQIHHIATNKGGWAPDFEAIFEPAGMTLNHPANRVLIKGHYGPHPPPYHMTVMQTLLNAVEGKEGAGYKAALEHALMQLRLQLITPGTPLNGMISR